MDPLPHHGVTALGRHVSWAELVGQLAALGMVLLARHRGREPRVEPRLASGR